MIVIILRAKHIISFALNNPNTYHWENYTHIINYTPWANILNCKTKSHTESGKSSIFYYHLVNVSSFIIA